MSDTKWISDVHADTPLTQAAQRVLAARLETVGKYVQLVAKQENGDPEHVHQLRVSSRRAAAALDMFAHCLAGKAAVKAKKRLKRLRRTAGAARDWDVFLASLSPRAGLCKDHRAGLELVKGYALGQGLAARRQLEEAAQDFADGFNPFAQKALNAIARHSIPIRSQTLLQLARGSLFPLIRGLQDAAAQDLSDDANLHQVRIAGKKLRYAMEILAPCFESGFRERLYPAVEKMQEILGRANDSRFAIARLHELRLHLETTRFTGWKRYRPTLADFIVYHERRVALERQRFLRWWKQWEKTGGEPAFVSLLQYPRVHAS
jgi:CHAD domain-containing protein